MGGPHLSYNELSGGERGGDLIALTGANGSGKSTLLRLLATVLTPQGGDALLDGMSLLKEARTLRRRIAWAGNGEGGLFPRDTALTNLRLLGALLNKPRCAVDDAIAFCDGTLQLTPLLGKPCGSLSTGQRARVSLCRALIGFPSLLLLDEPTRSMDGDFSARCWALLGEYARSHTVITATHDERGVRCATKRWNLTPPSCSVRPEEISP